MMQSIFKGFELVDAIYTKKGFDASQNLKDNFGVNIQEAMEQAQTQDVLTEELFKQNAKRTPGMVGVIARNPRVELIEGVEIGTVSIFLFKNSGKHHLLPSWLPSGEIQVRLVKEPVIVEAPAKGKGTKK